MIVELSENSLVTLLLCSNLSLSSSESPLSDVTYDALAHVLFLNGLEPSDLFRCDKSQLQSLINSSEKLRKVTSKLDLCKKIVFLLRRHQQVYIELDSLHNYGVNVITRADRKIYPGKLIEKFKLAGFKLPAVMYYCGSADVLSNKCIAVVGSRLLDDIDPIEQFISKFVSLFNFHGYSLSSGGAKGVDTIAEISARDNNVSSIITVSDNLIKRTQSSEIRHSIMQGRSLYLSLEHPQAPFRGFNAMKRNKIIYALSDYAMIVNATYKTKKKGEVAIIDYNKGGTWVGAHECYKYNLSKLMVRSCGENTPSGNKVMLETLKDVIEVSESKLFSDADYFSCLLSRSQSSNHLNSPENSISNNISDKVTNLNSETGVTNFEIFCS